jgi:hypothetical protein
MTIVTLLGRHEFDAAVAVLVVVPVDERYDPLTSLLFGGKGLAGGNQADTSPFCTEIRSTGCHLKPVA